MSRDDAQAGSSPADTPMDHARLQSWLLEYGRAWEQRDARRFADLFSPTVRYHWTPFEEPKRGRGALADAFTTAVDRQEAIRFASTVLAFSGRQGIAHWRCSFSRPGSDVRVSLDGVFLMEFDAGDRCEVFREWWHSDEPR